MVINVIDYLELYKTCLKVIAEQKPNQTSDFIDKMSNEDVIKYELEKGVSSQSLVGATFEVLDNLTNDGLIKASKTLSKTHEPIYFFYGVSTAGYKYLNSLEEPSFIEKSKAVIKEEGIPLTPNAISKVLAKLIL